MNIKQIFNDFATELLPDYKTEAMSFKNFKKAAKYIIDSQKIICRLEKPVSDDLGGRNCSTCNNWDAYTTGIDEYPQCTGIAYCKKGHWENGRPNDDYTKCFIDCVDWEKNDSPNSR